MKYIDAFLKKLKTDRNTFLTYILMLISVYIVVDRLIEIIFIATTGISLSYWGPLKYSLAILCPVFALQFSFSSKFVTEDTKKLSFLYIFVIGFYIIVASMIIQWINQICWVLLFSVPNYSYIIQNFFELIKPAFSAVAWYIPITTVYPIFKKCYTWINDTKDIRDSIFDCPGIDLSDNKEGWGPYTCEMLLCKDSETGKIIKTPEGRRFESTLIVGVSGSGKTSMVFEPMIARDLEKKFFFRESSKELGYTALRTGLATLNMPYSNEYLNGNFNLNMLTPNPDKEKLYKSFMNKLIVSNNNDEYQYKNLGITYMAPDYETIEHMTNVANNFGFSYRIIDPDNSLSDGINPFVYDDPIKASLAVSAILQQMYLAEFSSANLSGVTTSNSARDTTLANQAIENLVVLLKLVFPKLNEGMIPTLEDLLNVINNFSLIEKMTKILEKDQDLSEKYRIQIDYFKNNFFSDSENKKEIARQLKIPAAQIETLLRYPGVKNILCNRTKNINYDNALKDGEIIFVCTRRGDLGAGTQRAFGLFFLLLMQQSVLSRPGTEKTRIPHFLYIDEFPPFITKATEDIFTLYRKYRVGTIISAQNLSQFGAEKEAERNSFRQTLLANCTTKIVFGNNTPEDNNWWNLEFGDKREWTFTNSYHTSGKGQEDENPAYDENYQNIKYSWVKNYAAGKIQSLKFKQIIYKTKDLKGKNIIGKAKIDFLESRYKEPQKIKQYNFTKFTKGISNIEEETKPKFNLKNINFSDDSIAENGPIAHNQNNNSFKQNKNGDVEPIQLNSNTNQAIDDFNNNDENDE